MLGVGLVVLAGGVAVRLADLRLQTVLGDSMRPAAAAGDVAVTQAVPAGSIRAGDVITFLPPSGTQLVMHRVAAVRAGVLTTRGDANSMDDPWQITPGGPTIYRLIGVVPFVGWLADLQRPALWAAAVLFGFLILRELWKGVGAHRTPAPS